MWRSHRLLVAVGLIAVLAVPGVSRSGEYCSPLLTPNAGSIMDVSQKRGYAYKDAAIQWLLCDGHQGFVIVPQNVKRKVGEKSPWVWDIPAWAAIGHNYDFKNDNDKKKCDEKNQCKYPDNRQSTEHYWYISRLLEKGFYVVGLEVGVTYGAPRGALAFQEFYTYVRRHYPLQERTRLIGQSNGGLIAMAWAFRNPHEVDRIAGIYPALDLKSWPGLKKIETEGGGSDLGFGTISEKQLQLLLPEVNPIDKLEPLAEHKVKLFFTHGKADGTVNYKKNSEEAEARYKKLNGEIILDPNNLDHGEHPVFYESPRLLDFLAQ